MTDTTTETKAETMDRLRRENRWPDASAFRENCRLKAKREGLTRSDARERSWREMAEAYPALTQEEIDAVSTFRWLVIADFAPESIRHIDADDNLSFDDLWRATAFAIAIELAKANNSQFGWLSVVGDATALIRGDAASDSLKGLLSHATWSPLRFIKTFALPRFSRLLADEAGMGDDLEEMRCYCNSLQRLNSDNVLEIFGA